LSKTRSILEIIRQCRFSTSENLLFAVDEKWQILPHTQQSS